MEQELTHVQESLAWRVPGVLSSSVGYHHMVMVQLSIVGFRFSFLSCFDNFEVSCS